VKDGATASAATSAASITLQLSPLSLTEDSDTLVLHEDKWKAQFRGNVLDLGAFRFFLLIFASSDIPVIDVLLYYSSNPEFWRCFEGVGDDDKLLT